MHQFSSFLQENHLFPLPDEPELKVLNSSGGLLPQPIGQCHNCQRMWDEASLLELVADIDWETKTFVSILYTYRHVCYNVRLCDRLLGMSKPPSHSVIV